ncbi:hypothetical protein LCGC14_2550120 [marine sediment metagenome]|uniref:Uncharacterized protein n=1 Tax=marine sediment metagenome TaxID=412755 RepID=A0A0F9AN02_9ZZZZ
MDYKELTDSEDVIDAAVEWYGKKWHKGMMYAEMRKWFPGVSIGTMNRVLKIARHKICALYGIDPLEYKGSQISFYESILRDNKNKVDSQIKAAERLDKLFGLEQVSGADPADLARKVIAFKKEIEEQNSGEDEENGDGGNKHEGNGGNEPTDIPKENLKSTETKSTDGRNDVDEDIDLPDTLTPEMLKELRFNNDNKDESGE